MEVHSEDFSLVFKNYSDLSYSDDGDDDIALYHNNKFCGLLEVWTDRENGNREYVIVNCEMIYLDSIKRR